MARTTSRLKDFRTDYKVGESIPAEVFNTICKFVANFSVTGNGFFQFKGEQPVLHVRGGGSGVKPYDISFKGLNGSNGEINIHPGTATARAASGPDSVVPEIGTDPLNDDPAPVLTFATGGTDDGTHRVYLGCEVNGSAEVVIDTWKVTLTKPGDTPPPNVAYDVGPAEVMMEAYLLLGTFDVSGSTVSNINNFIRASVMMTICDIDEARVVWSGIGATP